MDNKFVLLENIVYGNHERNRLDIFIPEKVKAPQGLILFIHGGGWQAGDKTAHHPDAEYFCNKGYISASMNYRYVDENVTVYDELDDVNSALGKIKNECAEKGFVIEKVILSGGSAGAHLSLMYAYTRKENSPVKPVAVGAYCPPVDCASPDFCIGLSKEFESWKYAVLSCCTGVKITKNDFMYKPQQEALKKMSPQEYLTKDCVPTAVFQGIQDELVPFGEVENFVRMLDEKGIKHDFVIYENSNHALDKDPDKSIESKKIIEKYAEMCF